MSEIPIWVVYVWGGLMLALLFHVGSKLDEIAKILKRDQISN